MGRTTRAEAGDEKQEDENKKMRTRRRMRARN
jgi:hypothetical protein